MGSYHEDGRSAMTDPDRLISGKVRYYAILSGDASTSLSPLMHNRAFEIAGQADSRLYIALTVPPEKLVGVFNAIKGDPNYYGLSVTTPHKESIIPLIGEDNLSQAARDIKAVNTVRFKRSGKGANSTVEVEGLNTDWMGIVVPFEVREIDMAEKKFAIVGAGGAARSAAYAINKQGGSGKIFNRTLSRAKALAQEFGFEAGPLSELDEIEDYDVIVEATSNAADRIILPMDRIHEGQIVFPLAYSPFTKTTRLEDAAYARGASIINPREMLLYQGVAQSNLFTDAEPPLDEMRKIVLETVLPVPARQK